MTLKQIAGYSIVRTLAVGGTAQLYLALDHRDRHVLIRTLRPEYQHRHRYIKQFMHAASLLEKINHPNIVEMLETGKSHHVPYMILSYYPSPHLRQRILHKEAMLHEQPIPIIRQMADVLYYLHSRHILHLDFKPENILISDGGTITLLDFDLARIYKNKKIHVKDLPGTPAYIAPEVLFSQRADEQADIYSFGITCYELITFHKPFEHHSHAREQQQQYDSTTPPTPVSHYRDDVPDALSSMIFKCLAKRPEDRYPSMSLVLKDLQGLV